MRKRLIKFAQVATLGLALTFTFNCSSDKDDDNSGGGGLTGTSGTFKDDRDSISYKWVKIGKQTWMAENLNYAGSGKCYKKDPANCTTYGRLYYWSAAKEVCPSGWHLPDTTEWNVLMKEVGGYSTAGKYLKAESGWGENGNGIDKYGFAALPGGYGQSGNATDRYLGSSGYWWSATEGGPGGAFNQQMSDNGDDVSYGSSRDPSLYFSIRCIKD